MEIKDFAELIRCMPYREQAFEIKKEIWLPKKDERERVKDQDNSLKEIFSTNESIIISRDDLFKLIDESDLDDIRFKLSQFVIRVLMWGYPTKGRGRNIEKILLSKNFDQTINILTELIKKKNISIDDVEKLFSEGLKLSTVSKFLYFLKLKIDNLPCLILDNRVINALNSGRFQDKRISEFEYLKYENALQKYCDYLNFIHFLAKQMTTDADKVEMFLYKFGSNLKELSENNFGHKKTEKVFEILGEGGGIQIRRQINNSGTKFIYHHNEFDPTKEGLDVSKKDEYNNFEHSFQLINDRYPWYLLHLKTVHDDYKNFIIERLIEKLNDKSALLENFEYHKSDLEDILKIKLHYSITKRTNEFTWSYEKIR